MIQLLAILFPVFGLMAAGAGLRHTGFLKESMESCLNRFCYFVALPAFIVIRVADAPVLAGTTLHVTLALQSVSMGLWLLGHLLAPLFRVQDRSRGTFTQVGFRGNLAYVGLPVLMVALEQQPPEIQQAVGAEASLVIGGVVLLYNLMGVAVLEWDRRHEQEGSSWRNGATSLARNPLLLACAAGLIWRLSPVSVPDILQRTASPVGAAAFPLALLAIGARISSLNLHHFSLPVAGAVLLKNGVSLLLGLGAASLFGLSGTSRLLLLILCACPTALATYVLVDQMNGDRDLTASSIALSTAVSILSLAGSLHLGL